MSDMVQTLVPVEGLRDDNAEFYHIDENADATVCTVGADSCSVIPFKGYVQFHSDIKSEVYNVIDQQYYDTQEGVERFRLSENVEITDTLVGSPETDVARLVSPLAPRKRLFGTTYHMWLLDTAGHTAAYIKVAHDTKANTLSLYDLEVRSQFRGRGLAQRTIRAVEAKFGLTMTHDGGYTPEGLRSIAPLFHDEQWIKDEKDKT